MSREWDPKLKTTDTYLRKARSRGGLASTANTLSGAQTNGAFIFNKNFTSYTKRLQQGANIMLGGIVFQLGTTTSFILARCLTSSHIATLIVFVICATEFLVRYGILQFVNCHESAGHNSPLLHCSTRKRSCPHFQGSGVQGQVHFLFGEGGDDNVFSDKVGDRFLMPVPVNKVMEILNEMFHFRRLLGTPKSVNVEGCRPGSAAQLELRGACWRVVKHHAQALHRAPSVNTVHLLPLHFC